MNKFLTLALVLALAAPISAQAYDKKDAAPAAHSETKGEAKHDKKHEKKHGEKHSDKHGKHHDKKAEGEAKTEAAPVDGSEAPAMEEAK